MAVIDHIDGPNRDIYLHIDTMDAEVHPVDIYKEMRTLRRTDENLRKYDLFLKAEGYVSKGEGKFTAILVTCLDGTRIIPYDSTHVLTITGEIITDEETSGVACFDRSGLTPGVEVDINYVPPQVEVIEIASGSALSPEQATQLLELYKLAGLALGLPMTVTPASRNVDDIELEITGDGETTTTVERQ